jgi:hypothetical protein
VFEVTGKTPDSEKHATVLEKYLNAKYKTISDLPQELILELTAINEKILQELITGESK